MNQNLFVCNYKNIDFSKLKIKIDIIWRNREKIKKNLKSELPRIERLVFSGGKIIKNLVNKTIR